MDPERDSVQAWRRSPRLLPPALHAALTALPDPPSAHRLRQICEAAAQTLGRLTDLDLLQYESPVTSSSPDLSTWEEMAPVVAGTLREVNAFVDLIRTTLAAPSPQRGNDLESLVDEAVAELSAESRRRLDAVLGQAATRLSEQVQALGARVRDPAVVSDRWNLLAEVQAFRTRFREQIGTLVFDAISLFADVDRSDVVPGHSEEVRGAVAVRSSVTDLRRVLEARGDKARVAEPEDVQWHAQHLEGEMDAFGKTAAYRALRAQDKRRIIEYRQHLRDLAAQPLPGKGEVIALCLQFLEFVKGLAVVNQRALLLEHDREVWARTGVKLEQVEAHLREDPAATAAAVALAEAADVAGGLYGRSEQFDEFLRRARRQSFALLAPEDVPRAVEDFRLLVASLPFTE